MARVALKNVGKVYAGGTRAVEDVSIEIAKGEFIVLVGPSGCGKSTTLRMVAGLEDISEGTIEIAGRVVNDLAPKERDIAMVFQNYALYPHMTVFQNMAFALTLRGTSKTQIERKVKQTAEILGISKLLLRKPGQLSGGERQRVAVGRAMVREPAVYLFDEPLSNLDARLRVEMRAELKRLHASLKTTTLYVTHDQEEAMTLGDRVVVMSEGRVQQCSPPLEVFERPVNRFVAGFLGTPPMNFLEGSLANGPSFRGAGLCLKLPAELERPLSGHPSIVLGVRPEHIALTPKSKPPSAADTSPTAEFSPTARVELIEPLGSFMDVYLTTQTGQRIVARVQAAFGIQAGDTVGLSIAERHIHIFAPGSHGENLSLKAAARAAA